MAKPFVRPSDSPKHSVELSTDDLFEAASMLLAKRRLLPLGPGKGGLTLRPNGTALYEYWERQAPLEAPLDLEVPNG